MIRRDHLAAPRNARIHERMRRDILAGLSATKAIFQQELTAARVKETRRLGADVSKQAWERVGRNPPMAMFTDPSAGNVRGLPVWEHARWTF